MRKNFLLFFCSFLLIIFNIFPKSQAYAESKNCTLTTDPKEITTNDKVISTVTIKTQGLSMQNKYLVKLDGNVLYGGFHFDILLGTGQKTASEFSPDSDGVITANGVARDGGLLKDSGVYPFQTGNHSFEVYSKDGARQCGMTFAVKQANATTTDCTIEFINKEFTPEQGVAFKAPFNKGNDNDEHRILLIRDGPTGKKAMDTHATTKQLRDAGADLGTWEVGRYYLEIHQSYFFTGQLEGLACSANFNVVPVGSSGGGVITPAPTFPPLPPPCSKWVGDKCTEVNTALGTFNTEPQKFIGRVLGLVLGLSGGIALLLIIMSGYKIMASQGNPEKLQGAREGLTSAIVGLIFIIFSFIILQLIGADILRIPGFKP